MRNFIRHLLVLLAASTFLFSPGMTLAQEKEPGIVDSILISMPNGTLPKFTSDQVDRVKEIVAKLRENPSYSIAVIATYSKVPWHKRYGPRAGEALQGSIAVTRAGVTDRLLVTEAGMTRSEIATRYSWAVLLDETKKIEPYVEVLLAEKAWIADLMKQLEGKLNAAIENLKQELKKELPEELKKEWEGWIRTLIDEQLKEKGWGNEASLLLPVEKGKLSALSDKDLEALTTWIAAANARTDAKVLIYAANPEAAEEARALFKDKNLLKEPTVILFESQTDPEEIPVVVSLARGLGGGESPSPPEPGAETGGPKTKPAWGLLAGLGLNWSSGWNDHQTPGVGGANIFPTVDAGLTWGEKVSLVCKLQLPGSLFENEGGEVRLAEVELLARVFEPVCASVSYEQYASRHEYRSPYLPGVPLVFGEKATGWSLGAEAYPSSVGLWKGLGIGAKLLFVDREYELPPRFVVQKNGDVQVRFNVSYRLSFFP